MSSAIQLCDGWQQSGAVIITLYTAYQSTVHPSPDMRRAVTDQQTQDVDPMLL